MSSRRVSITEDDHKEVESARSGGLDSQNSKGLSPRFQYISGAEHTE